jgi:hypothetical protein
VTSALLAARYNFMAFMLRAQPLLVLSVLVFVVVLVRELEQEGVF